MQLCGAEAADFTLAVDVVEPLGADTLVYGRMEGVKEELVTRLSGKVKVSEGDQLPLLLDREVDFVTAMITSFQTVLANVLPMVAWGMAIAVLLFLAMVPGFLGLFCVLPVLGHASWHLYALIKT